MGIRSNASIQIVITDEDGNRILTWRPGSGNIAVGIKKACEVAVGKLGVDLQKEGIVVQGLNESIETKNENVIPEVIVDGQTG